MTAHSNSPHTQLHPPVHLEEKQRLEKVLAKLRAETQQGSVIALQEVSRGWAGQLHTFFARAGYHFVHCEPACVLLCARMRVFLMKPRLSALQTPPPTSPTNHQSTNQPHHSRVLPPGERVHGGGLSLAHGGGGGRLGRDLAAGRRQGTLVVVVLRAGWLCVACGCLLCSTEVDGVCKRYVTLKLTHGFVYRPYRPGRPRRPPAPSPSCGPS